MAPPLDHPKALQLLPFYTVNAEILISKISFKNTQEQLLAFVDEIISIYDVTKIHKIIAVVLLMMRRQLK